MTATSPAAPLSGSLLDSVADPVSLPPIDVPAAADVEEGIHWSQLADSLHTAAPRNITIIYDAPLGGLARRLQQLLESMHGARADLVTVTGKRSDPSILTAVVASNPDLAFDLMVNRVPESTGGRREEAGIEIWGVHDALWPAAASSETNRLPYRSHQFQNLALGSMIRAELARGYPDLDVSFELAPSYLLRRVNAVSAGILIPESLAGDGSGQIEHIAHAIATGLSNYSRGIQSASAGRHNRSAGILGSQF